MTYIRLPFGDTPSCFILFNQARVFENYEESELLNFNDLVNKSMLLTSSTFLYFFCRDSVEITISTILLPKEYHLTSELGI